MKSSKYEIVKQELKGGIFPAVPVPFYENGDIDEDAQDKYIKYMQNQPAAGFAIWAHTGRGLLINDEKNAYIMNSWRKAFPEKLIIAGVGANIKQCINKENPEIEYLKRSLEMAQKAKELKADAILVYAPSIFRNHKNVDEKVIEYHREIAKIGLPLIVFYLYEQAGGISYSNKVLDGLLNMSEIVGIKMATLDSAMTYQDISKLIQKKFSDKVLITGEDRMFGYTLMRGAEAALVGIGSACTSLQKEMMNSYYEGNFNRFIDLSYKVDKLAECTFVNPMEGYIKRMLTVLGIKGVIPMESTYDPFGPIKELNIDEIKQIESVLKEIGEL